MSSIASSDGSAAKPNERFAFVVLALVVIAYAAAHLAFCYRDDAPRAWDESYFLYLPTAVLGDLRAEGIGAALHTFWDTTYAKPPLSMFGTLPAMFLFGEGNVGSRIDNLVVALGAIWLCYRLLRVMMAPALAAVFAAGLALAPYSLLFSRIEFAELYLWASTILYLLVLLRCEAFRARGWTLLLGVAFGLGMLCKVSFPLVMGPPTLWVAIAGLHRDGWQHKAARVRNALLAGVIGAAMFVPFYAKNWKPIRQHFLNQFGWLGKEYTIGDPFSAETFSRYFQTWFAWYGELWIWLGWLALGLAVVTVLSGRGRGLLSGWPAGPLLVGGVVNLVYCYFHPVFDPRFSYGTMLLLQMGTACLLARCLAAFGLDRPWLAGVLLLPFLGFLGSNSFRPGDGERVLEAPAAAGPARSVLFPPVHGEDLAEPLLALEPVAPGQALWIALAGDHMRFSNDSIRLLMRRKRIAGDVIQLGYFGPDPTVRERFQRARQAVLWCALIDRGSGRESSWASRYAPEALAVLRANPTVFEELPWRGNLPEQVEVVVFRRRAEFDAAALVVPDGK